MPVSLRPRRRNRVVPDRQPGWTVRDLRAVLRSGDRAARVLIAVDGPANLITDDMRRVLESYHWVVTSGSSHLPGVVVLHVEPDVDDPAAPYRSMVDDEREGREPRRPEPFLDLYGLCAFAYVQ